MRSVDEAQVGPNRGKSLLNKIGLVNIREAFENRGQGLLQQFEFGQIGRFFRGIVVEGPHRILDGRQVVRCCKKREKRVVGVLQGSKNRVS